MKFSIGNKVRFLDEAIEGFVIALPGNGRVEVKDVNGFIHKTSIDNLVLETFRPEESAEELKQDAKTVSAKHGSLKEQITDKQISEILHQNETLYMTASLADEQNPISSDFELSLLNNSSCRFVFVASLISDSINQLMKAGNMNVYEHLRLGIFSQDTLHRFEGIYFRFLLFQEDHYKTKPPIEKKVKITSTDFLESGRYEKKIINGDQTLLIPLYTVMSDTPLDIRSIIDKYDRDVKDDRKHRITEAKDSRKASRTINVSGRKSKTVDLHIEELVKDFSGMSPKQILALQLQVFKSELEKAHSENYNSIIFIHGVGAGTLKYAIRDEAKHYPFASFTDAPMEEFGSGATVFTLV